MKGTNIISNNRKYIISDLCGILLSYSLAIPFTVMLGDLNFSDKINVISTFIVKAAGFIIGKTITHREHTKQIINSTIQATGLKSIVELAGHYIFLTVFRVPYYLAPLIAYGIPGAISLSYRYWKDYKAGIIK